MKKGTKVFHVIEYYNNTVSYFDIDSCKTFELPIGLISFNPVHFKVISEEVNISNKEGFITYISKVKGLITPDIIGDTAFVLLYEMQMDENQFTDLKKMLSSLSEEEIILKVFQQNLYNNSISLINTLVVNFESTDKKYIS